MATTATADAVALARVRSSPVVFRARNSAPCRVKSASVVTPPSSAYGLRKVQKLPVKCSAAFSGMPRTMLPNATPHSRAGTSEPRKIATSQRPRHPAPSRLPRYSNATPRMISATRMSSSGR